MTNKERRKWEVHIDPLTVFDELMAMAKPKQVNQWDTPQSRAQWAANRKARKEAAAERAIANYRKRRMATDKTYRKYVTARWGDGTPIKDHMVEAMEPGEWYGAGDLAVLVGEKYGLRAARHAHDRGLFDRVRNAGYTGERTPDAKRVSRWLYKLSAKGEARRVELILGLVPSGSC